MRITIHSLSPWFGVLSVSLAAMLWGTVGIATQSIYQSSELSAVSVGFYRLALAFPFVAVLCWRSVGSGVLKLAGRNYLKMVFAGVMLAGYQVLYFAAIGHIGVTLAALITLCTAPVLVSIASALFLGEPLTQTTLRALVCALLGVALLVGFSEGAGVSGDLLLGVSLSLGSAAGYAFVVLIGRSMANSCHPVHLTAISFGVGALLLLPLSVTNVISVQYTDELLVLLLYVGLIPTAVAYTLFFWGMRKVKASTASILTMIEPLTAAFLAWALFGERLTLTGAFGVVLLLLAVVILYRGEVVPQRVGCCSCGPEG